MQKKGMILVEYKQTEIKKGNPLALLPLGVFLVLFVGSGLITGDFYKMPSLVAFLIAGGVALLFNRKVSLEEKMNIFCKGAGDNFNGYNLFTCRSIFKYS